MMTAAIWADKLALAIRAMVVAGIDQKTSLGYLVHYEYARIARLVTLVAQMQ